MDTPTSVSTEPTPNLFVDSLEEPTTTTTTTEPAPAQAGTTEPAAKTEPVAPVPYTQEEIQDIINTGKGLDPNRLTPEGQAAYKLLWGDYTRKTQEVGNQRRQLEEFSNALKQQEQFLKGIEEKVMTGAQPQDKLYIAYRKDPMGTTNTLRQAIQEADSARVNPAFSDEDRMKAQADYQSLTEAARNLQMRVQTEGQVHNSMQMNRQMTQAAILQVVPDFAESQGKLNEFVTQNGIDNRVIDLVTDGAVLDAVLKSVGVMDISGPQAAAQIVRFVKGIYDKTAGITAKAKQAPPNTVVTPSRTVTTPAQNSSPEGDPSKMDMESYRKWRMANGA